MLDFGRWARPPGLMPIGGIRTVVSLRTAGSTRRRHLESIYAPNWHQRWQSSGDRLISSISAMAAALGGPAATAQPARSASAPSWTSAVAAARSGPGSRSPSRWRTPRPDPAKRLGDAGAGRRALRRRASRRSSACAATSSSIARIRSTWSSDRPRVPRRDRAHRDVVLLVRARRDRVDRRRMGEDLVLRHEGGRRVLVDHHPGVDARTRPPGTAAARR